MKILVTGTHFTPAQATIEELIKDSLVEIVYVGRKSTREGDDSPSVESPVLKELNVRFIPVVSGRLQRSFTIYTIPSLLKIPFGFLQAFLILIKEKPDAVLSFGGYISVPVVVLAWFLSIPVILHEQTLVSGLANRINSYFADKIALSFSENHVFDGKNTILTGNPLRKEILGIDNNMAHVGKNVIYSEKLPVLLVTGGNQGSHIINQTLAEILPELTQIAYVIHQTGDSKFADYEQLVKLRLSLKNPERFLVTKWVDAHEMGYVLKSVDLAVSRAGINTLLELAYFGIPTLVIPIPYLYQDEQNVNGKFFTELGLTRVLPQRNLTGKNLLENIKNMIKDLKNLKEKAKEAKKVVIPDAAKRLALETMLLVNHQNI